MYSVALSSEGHASTESKADTSEHRSEHPTALETFQLKKSEVI